VGKTLLLEVDSRASERGALGSGREDRSPGGESTLHGYGNKLKKIKEERNMETTQEKDGVGRRWKKRRKLGRDEAKVSKIFPDPQSLAGETARTSRDVPRVSRENGSGDDGEE
jgi:hypothetical protein